MPGQTMLLRRPAAGRTIAPSGWPLLGRLAREIALWRWRRGRQRAGEVMSQRRPRGRAYMFAPSRPDTGADEFMLN